MFDDLNKKLEPVSWMEIGVYTVIVTVSLLTCYMVGVSIFVTGTPWNADVTNNVLNWMQIIAMSVIILELERIRQYCLCTKREMFKKKRRK